MKKLINWFISIFKKKPKSQDEIKEVSKMTEEKKKYLISKDELLKAGDPVPQEYQDAFNKFYEKINDFRNKCEIPMYPTSYFRSKDRQIRIYKDKAKKKEFPFKNGIYDQSKVPLSSKHMTGYACDFADNDKKLATWVLNNKDWCKENGFYFEDFNYTKTWCHIQIIPPKSGKMIFIP